MKDPCHSKEESKIVSLFWLQVCFTQINVTHIQSDISRFGEYQAQLGGCRFIKKQIFSWYIFLIQVTSCQCHSHLKCHLLVWQILGLPRWMSVHKEIKFFLLYFLIQLTSCSQGLPFCQQPQRHIHAKFQLSAVHSLFMQASKPTFDFLSWLISSFSCPHFQT